MPEREIDEEDTETAELQSTLRRCQQASRPGSDKEEAQEDRRSRRAGSNPEREILSADTETAQFQSNLRKLATFSQSAGVVSESAEPEGERSSTPGRSNKTVFRPGMRGQQGLRRSRTWESFSSGLRYESVSDKGMPPPPPAPAPNKR